MNDPRPARPNPTTRDSSTPPDRGLPQPRRSPGTADRRDRSRPDRRDRSRPYRSPEELRISIHQTATATQIIAIGEWDLAQRQTALNTIQTVLERSPRTVVLDLSQLAFIDSSGIHNILELRDGCTRGNVHLVIVPGSPAVQRVFEITGLTNLLPFVRSEP